MAENQSSIMAVVLLLGAVDQAIIFLAEPAAVNDPTENQVGLSCRERLL